MNSQKQGKHMNAQAHDAVFQITHKTQEQPIMSHIFDVVTYCAFGAFCAATPILFVVFG